MKTDDNVEKETKEDVTTETPAQEEGETYEQEGGSENVPLTEEFQREVMSLVGGATKAECSFMRDCIMEREDELRKEEEEKEPTSMESYNKVKQG